MFIGTGTTIAFGTSNYSAEIIDITLPEAVREKVDVTHMGSTDAREYMPKTLIDWGPLTIEVGFVSGTLPPIQGDPETVTITFPTSGSPTWEFQGFVSKFSPKVPLEDKATATLVVEVDGMITVTA